MKKAAPIRAEPVGAECQARPREEEAQLQAWVSLTTKKVHRDPAGNVPMPGACPATAYGSRFRSGANAHHAATKPVSGSRNATAVE